MAKQQALMDIAVRRIRRLIAERGIVGQRMLTGVVLHHNALLTETQTSDDGAHAPSSYGPCSDRTLSSHRGHRATTAADDEPLTRTVAKR
jgi:hypothetical protein